MQTRRAPFALPLVLCLLGGCSSVQDDLGKQILKPPPGELCTPADFGLAAEPFAIELHAEASLTGYFVPAEHARGTVVLFHDEQSNASIAHPYYTFLHDAGFHVVAFDPRGFGKSKGTPTLQAWIHDTPVLLEWLRARKDVDPQRIGFFGTGWGAVTAAWAARTQAPCAALVLESLVSPRSLVREATNDDGSLMAAMSSGMLEFAGIPEDIEPEEGAGRTHAPALFVAGELENARDRQAQLRTFLAWGGRKRLWMLPATRQAPHGLVTHDGEYQRQIAAFFTDAFDGHADALAADATKTSAASDGQAWYEIHVDAGATGNQPVEACALLGDGSPHFARAQLENGQARVRVKLPSAPAAVGAVAIAGAVAPDVDRVWQRVPTAVSLAAAALEPLLPRIDELRNGALTASAIAKLADDLRAAEGSTPFPPRVTAELADVFALLGRSLSQRPEPQRRQEGRALLERAVASVPAKPATHWWPGVTTTWGFPQQEAVDTAKRALAAAPK